MTYVRHKTAGETQIPAHPTHTTFFSFVLNAFSREQVVLNIGKIILLNSIISIHTYYIITYVLLYTIPYNTA